MSKNTKNLYIAGIAIVLVGLLVFAEVIRPNQDAKSYTWRLQTASKPLEACFEKLADTTSFDIYYAPDIALKDKQKDAAAITSQISACRTELSTFNSQAHKLLGLHFAGYTGTYREAKVNQRQAYDVIGQSSDVLNQYGELADFLTQYFGHIQAFLSYFENLQRVEDSAATTANIRILSQQAADLHKRADLIRDLKSHPGFESMKLATSEMFDTIATGFDNVVAGYRNDNDYYRTTGFRQVDKAIADYDAKVINMPFEQLKGSYVPKQVQQLPVKVQNLLAAQSE